MPGTAPGTDDTSAPPPPTGQLDVDALYRRYAPVAYRRARRILGNEDDAREVVHDVFTSLLARPEQFSGHSRLTTFMYSAVTHACLNHLRNRRTRARLLEATPVSEALLARPPSPEVVAALRSALARLPAELAAVAVYYHAEGLTHADIARVLGCSPRHVGNLLVRARRHMTGAEPDAGDLP